MGSQWDSKVINDTGIEVLQLIWPAATARVDSGWTYARTGGTYHVSDGFISKWSKAYMAHKEMQYMSGHGGTQIRNRMRSMSNRPKHCGHPVRDRIRRSQPGG